MKTRIIAFLLLPVFLWGCDDIFDAGDADKVFDGDPQVEFKPLGQEMSETVGMATIDIQLIGEHQDSDIEVDFSTDGSAEEGVHYNLLTSSPVVIEAGTSSATVEIEIIDSGIYDETGEVQLLLNIDSASGGVEPAENLRQASIYVQEFSRSATLSTQALDLTNGDNEMLVTGLTASGGDYVFITPYDEDGDYEGADITGYVELEAGISGGSLLVDVDGADPVDYVAHVVRPAHVSESTLNDGEISAETAGNVAASSSGAALYHVAQFEWNDETHTLVGEEGPGSITVDVIEILYNGSVGEDEISIDLHAVDEEGAIGAFVGISQEDLNVGQVYNDVVVDVVAAVDPDDEDPMREDATIDETADFFAMAHLGAAGEDADGNRIPAQNPALVTSDEFEDEDEEIVLRFIPIGDLATVTVEDP